MSIHRCDKSDFFSIFIEVFWSCSDLISLHPSSKEKRRDRGPGTWEGPAGPTAPFKRAQLLHNQSDEGQLSRDARRLSPRGPLAFIIRTFSEARFCSTCDDGRLLLPGESVFSSLHTCWWGFVSLPYHTGTNFEILRGKKSRLHNIDAESYCLFVNQNNYSPSSVTKDLKICFLSYRLRRRLAFIFYFNDDKKRLICCFG